MSTDLDTVTSPMLSAALELAAAGWTVFPCIPTGPKGKAPISRACPNGHLNATRDPETIRAWWSRYPTAMIGAPVPDTLLVLDIDPRNGGSLEALCDRMGELPPTLTAWSGRGDGGRHLYFRRPSGSLTSTGLPEGVDLKANGYVILPPSRHPETGRPYSWEEREVAHLPTSAATVLRVKATPPLGTLARRGIGTGSVTGLVRAVADAREGSRNRLLYWACRRALEQGHDQGVLDQLVHAAVLAGLPETACRRTAASALSGHQDSERTR